jgi:hypothetical protein
LGDVLSAAGTASDDLLIGTDTRDVLAGGAVDWNLPSFQIIAMAESPKVIEGDWTVMQYLLSPVRRVGSEAARER